MDEFNLSDIDALSMGTSINDLNKKTNKQIDKPVYNPNINIKSATNSVNMNSLIKNVEKDLEYFTDNKSNKQNIEIDSNKITENMTEYEVKNNEPSNDNTELLIFVLLFIMLNNKFVIDVLESYIPYMSNSYPNLIFRGILFGFIIYKYKKYYNM
jgi:hypothetical protein